MESKISKITWKTFALMALLVLWALLVPTQYLLTQRFSMNHWKFLGFAMYTTPSPAVFISVHAKDRELGLAEIASKIGPQKLTYLKRVRELWGELWVPNDFAVAILEAYPQHTTLDIYINTVVLRSSSAMPDHRSDHYVCQRTTKLEGQSCVRASSAWMSNPRNRF